MNTIQTTTAGRRGRGAGLRSRRVALAAALMLPLGACSVDDILDVDDPGVVQAGQLTGPAALPSFRAAAIGDFQVAYSGSSTSEGLINMTGLFTDEFVFTETFPTRREVNTRAINPDNSTMRDIFFNVQRARASTERAAAEYAQHAANAAERAEMLALAGYSYVLIGEAYCGGVPYSSIDANGTVVEGDPTTVTQTFDRAIARFDEAITRATAASNAEYLQLARVGKARALLNKGDYAGAAAVAAVVPDTFQYLIFHSANAARQNNGVFSFSRLQGRWSVANGEGTNGLNFRPNGTAFDPRLPVDTVPGGTFLGTTLFHSLRHALRETDVVLANGIEAELIEAEADLNAAPAGNFVAMNAKLNNLRSKFAPSLTPLPVPLTRDEAINQLFSERAKWLYLTAHRQGDLRRLVRQYGRDQATVYPITGGTDVNFPIPVEELNNSKFKNATKTARNCVSDAA